LDESLKGERRIVFVTGEPGIGKTTLVEEFLRQEQGAREKRFLVARGQCIEHYGTGEGYLPLLDALGRLCRAPNCERLVELLDKLAPTWLAQMPALLDAAEWKELQSKAVGATHARMLQELAHAIEVLTAKTPIVLWLEDIHWSDYSTLEWLGFVARRRESARLLLFGTYRPVEVIVREHPLKHLKQELQIHGMCKELPLSLLSKPAVMEYLSQRFDSHFGSNGSASQHRVDGDTSERLRQLADTIYHRTDGNPLFMVNVIDYLVEQGAIEQFVDRAQARLAETFAQDRIDMPPSIVHMIERNLERLNPDERTVLEAASVTGPAFPSAAVAAALERPINEIETVCARLARRCQFVQTSGTTELPDGTVTGIFRFLHGLYRDVLYEGVAPALRIELHRRIAERGEQAYGDHVGDVAVELAYHYRRGGQRTKTVKYLELAAERAMARRAYHEAERHYRDAIEVLRTLPESVERTVRELPLRQAIVALLQMTSGLAAANTVDAVGRLGALVERSGDVAKHIASLTTRAITAFSSAELITAINRADEVLGLSAQQNCRNNIGVIHTIQILARHFLGDLMGAEEHFLAVQGFFDEPVWGEFPGAQVFALGTSAWTAWMLGRADIALQRIERATATHGANPFNAALADMFSSQLYTHLRDWEQSETLAHKSLAASEKNGFPQINAYSQCLLGHARSQLGRPLEGIQLIRDGIRGMLEIGSPLPIGNFMTYLAIAQGHQGAVQDALHTLEQTLDTRNHILVHRPETLRIRAELRSKHGLTDLVESDFREAIALARSIGAKAFELRTITNLSMMLKQLGRRNEARMMLAEVYSRFTEGLDTSDVREAKLLLDELH
jgi:tetratricopeptide (TPR) repeat protein